MFAWIKNILVTVVIAAVALAVWKYFGGNFDSFFTTVWGAFYGVVNALSDVLVSAFNTVFHAAQK